MKYLAFIRHSESHREAGPPPALMEAMGWCAPHPNRPHRSFDLLHLLRRPGAASVQNAKGVHICIARLCGVARFMSYQLAKIFGSAATAQQ
jgi:hypothetical protein